MDSNRSRPGVKLPTETPSPLRGLAGKVLMFVFAATFLTSAAVAWVSLDSTNRVSRKMVDRLYPLSAEHAAARVKPWIDGIRLRLEYLSHYSMPEVTGGVDPRFDGLAIFDAQGRQTRTWGEVPETSRLALDRSERVAPVQLGDGEWALAVAPPWPSKGRQLVAVVNLARLAPRLAVELPGEGSMLAITDATGRVLTYAGQLPNAAVPNYIDIEVIRTRGTLREIEVLGQRLIGASQRLDLIGWHAVVLAPHSVAYAPVLEALKRVLLIDFGIIMLLSFLAYLASSRIVRPLEQLSSATQRVVRGETFMEIEESGTVDEIGLLTRTFNDMLRRIGAQREEIQLANRNLIDQNARLEQANEVLNQLSITDGLTKLHNHRFFQDHLTREIRRVDRSGDPLAILVLDIDDFKKLNDTHGHSAGDEILMRIALLLNETIRGSDFCARYGGEEFVVLTPETDMVGAYELAEKIRTAVAEASFIVDESMRPLRATVSIGVARFDGDRKRFFVKADQALYRAKANGKNCTMVNERDWPDDLGPAPA